jgi:predicted RNA-binding Zn-ribbon protein involved in translation (DUF1610 family)
MRGASGIRLGMSAKSHYCPHCGSKAVRRSRRKNLFEKTVCRLLFLNPYRCERCDGRYFVLGRRTPLTHAEASPSASPAASASNSPQTL